MDHQIIFTNIPEDHLLIVHQGQKILKFSGPKCLNIIQLSTREKLGIL